MKRSFPLFVLLIWLFSVAALTAWLGITKINNSNRANNSPSPSTTVKSPATNPMAATALNAQQVAIHSSTNDCWMIVNKNVYNVTIYVNQHPGGPSIARFCGSDATQIFDAVTAHNDGSTDNNNDTAVQALDRLLVGTLQ